MRRGGLRSRPRGLASSLAARDLETPPCRSIAPSRGLMPTQRRLPGRSSREMPPAPPGSARSAGRTGCAATACFDRDRGGPASQRARPFSATRIRRAPAAASRSGSRSSRRSTSARSVDHHRVAPPSPREVGRRGCTSTSLTRQHVYGPRRAPARSVRLVAPMARDPRCPRRANPSRLTQGRQLVRGGQGEASEQLDLELGRRPLRSPATGGSSLERSSGDRPAGSRWSPPRIVYDGAIMIDRRQQPASNSDPQREARAPRRRAPRSRRGRAAQTGVPELSLTSADLGPPAPQPASISPRDRQRQGAQAPTHSASASPSNLMCARVPRSGPRVRTARRAGSSRAHRSGPAPLGNASLRGVSVPTRNPNLPEHQLVPARNTSVEGHLARRRRLPFHVRGIGPERPARGECRSTISCEQPKA